MVGLKIGSISLHNVNVGRQRLKIIQWTNHTRRWKKEEEEEEEYLEDNVIPSRTGKRLVF